MPIGLTAGGGAVAERWWSDADRVDGWWRSGGGAVAKRWRSGDALATYALSRSPTSHPSPTKSNYLFLVLSISTPWLALYLYLAGSFLFPAKFFLELMEQKKTSKHPRFSTIDWLLLVGITAIVGGVAGFNVFAALIVLGALLLLTAYGLARHQQPGSEGKV